MEDKADDDDDDSRELPRAYNLSGEGYWVHVKVHGIM